MKEIALKLDDKTHKAFKLYCAKRGISMQKALADFVEYVTHPANEL